ncbi:uncharacterized protein LOC115447576 [Manduca sexta]|uniref:uncharacterized protein LOC115447576 n=1 Tax=Manduca sexta TaxID=7130 RepID=UPI00188E7B29|nr:uncharacterized protein LOC115447576 [Manduca sexta]
MSWNNDVVLEFLELYRREQHLWDPKHPLHRNRSENNDAWLRIQSALSVNFSVVDLKKKKESLMTSFRMHLHKKKKSHDGYCTTWFAYPLMESFLGGKYECDSTNQLEQEFYNAGGYTPQNSNLLEHNTTKIIGVLDRKQSKNISSNVSKGKKGGNSSEYIYPKKQMDSTVNYLQCPTGEKRETDEYELYGQLLAKKLKKLDEHQRDIAMHEIDNIMFRAKMQSGPTPSRSYSSSPSPVPRKLKSPIFIIAQQNNQQYEDENTSYQDHLQTEPPS